MLSGMGRPSPGSIISAIDRTIADPVPGMRPGAVKWNVLVALTYALAIVVFVDFVSVTG